MNPHQLRRLFPNCSEAVLKANAKDYGTGQPEVIGRVKPLGEMIITLATIPGFSITITGQIRGGKNNMIVTKKGKHVPKKEWAEWRDGAVADVSLQLPPSWEPISHPVNVHIDYVAGDRKRRDFPAICDAIWHVLERAGFVTDDTLLWPARSSRRYDKENPHAVITVIE